jgi:vacuolar protein sorting-associated protein 35
VQVVSCKDTIAQQYLMECIIQVFPDEFHLVTLEDLLGSCSQLQAGVDGKAILVALMNRLAAFAKAEPTAVPSDVDMLSILQAHVSSLASTNLELSAVLDLQVPHPQLVAQPLHRRQMD